MASPFITCLDRLYRYSEVARVPVEGAGKIILLYEKDRVKEQLTAEERREAHNLAAPQIAEIYIGCPNPEDLDPRDVAERVGLPDKQGARSFVRYQLKQLRLTHQPSQSAAAD